MDRNDLGVIIGSFPIKLEGDFANFNVAEVTHSLELLVDIFNSSVRFTPRHLANPFGNALFNSSLQPLGVANVLNSSLELSRSFLCGLRVATLDESSLTA